MKLFVTVKSTNKRKGYLTEQEFRITDNIHSLYDLLCNLSSQMVSAYTNKEIDTDAIKILTSSQVDDGIEHGKIGFGRKYGEGKVTEKEAEETMLTAFEDGLFRVFLNDSELTDLHEALIPKDGDKLIIIRVIMLAGSFLPYLF